MFGVGSLLQSGLAGIIYRALCIIYCHGFKPQLEEMVNSTQNEFDDQMLKMVNRAFGCENKEDK